MPRTNLLRMVLVSIALAVSASSTASASTPVGPCQQISPEMGRWRALTPPNLDGASLVFDPVGRRVFAFGRDPDGLRTDVWQLRIDVEDTWVPVCTMGEAPPPRDFGRGIFDPVRRRLVLFGGAVNGVPRADLWELTLDEGPAWHQITTVGLSPSARWGHTAVYDSQGDRMIVFAGSEGVKTTPWGAHYLTLLDDVWALSLADMSWEEIRPEGPLPQVRSGHTAAFDPAANRVLVFGGLFEELFHDVSQRCALEDLWELSLEGAPAWRQLTVARGSPGVRTGHSMVLDQAGNRLLVMGGLRVTATSISPLSDTWVLSLHEPTAWAQLIPSGAHPALTPGHASAFLPPDRVLIAGSSGGILRLSPSPSWEPLFSVGQLPPPRRSHAAVFDPDSGRLVIIGGYRDALRPYAYLNDAWTLDLSNGVRWDPVEVSGDRPAGRYGHTAIWDDAGHRVIVFGGSDDITNFSDVWELTTGPNAAWTQLHPTGTPPPARWGHSAIYDPNSRRMIVFGGQNGPGWVDFMDDAWQLSLHPEPSWVRLDPSGPAPTTRSEHEAIYDPSHRRMVMYGGSSLGQGLSEVWSLGLDGPPTWELLSPPLPLPPAGVYHTATYDPVRRRMIVFGGLMMDAQPWSFSLDGPPEWTALTPAGTPPPMMNQHVAVYDPRGDQMIFNHGHLLYALAWSEVTAVRLPSLGPTVKIAFLSEHPARRQIELAVASATRGPARIRLIDVQGRVRQELEYHASGVGVDHVTIRWPDGTMRPGVYFVTALAGSDPAPASKRLVILE
jgi:galactose oxidase-like protein